MFSEKKTSLTMLSSERFQSAVRYRPLLLYLIFCCCYCGFVTSVLCITHSLHCDRAVMPFIFLSETFISHCKSNMDTMLHILSLPADLLIVDVGWIQIITIDKKLSNNSLQQVSNLSQSHKRKNEVIK